jgi:dTDP-4-dehydrorhamnose reductase
VDKRKLLVTGANGVVGCYVRTVFRDWDVVSTDIDTLDVRDPKAVADGVAGVRPAFVLHLAAATDVDRCEQEPEWCFHTNAIGTQNVALACGRHKVPLIYVSSAAVFDGNKLTPYTEFDAPNPVNVYGEAKLAGEVVVREFVEEYYIVRAGWMIGGGAGRDKKFVGKIASLLAGGRKEIKAVNDKTGSPTYARDLLDGISRLIDTGYFGLYHLANSGSCSRYEVAVEMVRLLGCEATEIKPVSSAYFPLPAPRARSEAMRNYKAELLGLRPQRAWQDALGAYVHEPGFLENR